MTENAKIWFGTGNVAELKIPDGIRVVSHDWKCSSSIFKVCGEVLITNTQVLFLGFYFFYIFTV